MFEKEDFDKYSTQERLRASTYLASYVDFLKWTTTITLAAVAWVSSSGGVIFRTPTLASLAALVISLAFSVLGLKSVVATYAYEWDIAALHRSYSLLEIFKASKAEDAFVVAKKKELDGLFRKLDPRGADLHSSSRFNALLTWHVATLALGIVLAAIDRLLAYF